MSQTATPPAAGGNGKAAGFTEAARSAGGSEAAGIDAAAAEKAAVTFGGTPCSTDGGTAEGESACQQ
jgi:hypothetical protein